MSVHFEQIQVKAVHRETHECVSLAFDIPDHLKDSFRYKPGQHLTLRAIIGGKDIRRSYSLCSSPLEGEWRVAVKKVEGGVFSTWANEQLKPGDILEVMPPMGHFYTEPKAPNRNTYVAIAAGSGITPVLSIMKTILATETGSSITLLYGNRSRTAIIFREELERLKNKYLERLSIIHILSREMTDAPINHGRIDAEKCSQLFGRVAELTADGYFICGPGNMIFTVRDFLLQQGVDEKKIHFELFSENGLPVQQTETAQAAAAGGVKSHVSVKLDGIFFDVEVPLGGGILDAALAKGADLPYSCKGGMCCTCKARLLEGEVDMRVHYGLEPEEIDEGFILACQATAKTEKIVIDFDIK